MDQTCDLTSFSHAQCKLQIINTNDRIINTLKKIHWRIQNNKQNHFPTKKQIQKNPLRCVKKVLEEEDDLISGFAN